MSATKITIDDMGRYVIAKNAEIERLKAEVEMMTEQAIKFRDMAWSHAALLARAADALEEDQPLVREPVESDFGPRRALIAELRKAAE